MCNFPTYTRIGFTYHVAFDDLNIINCQVYFFKRIFVMVLPTVNNESNVLSKMKVKEV